MIEPKPSSLPLEAPQAIHKDRMQNLLQLISFVNSTLSRGELLERIMDVSKRVLNADTSTLYLIDEETNDLVFEVIEGGAGERLKELARLKIGQGIAGWVAQQEQAVLIPDAYQHPKFDPSYDRKTGYRTRSVVCVPLKIQDRVIGVSQVINKLDGSVFTQEDLELLEAFCAQAAIAVERTRLHEALLMRQRLEQDLKFATQIQQSFLPQSFPEVSDLAFAAKYLSAQEVGGDFYDVIKLSDTEIGLVLGDVSGKGVPAALYMARLMSDFRIQVLLKREPSKVLTALNNLLVQRSRRGMFVTLVYLLFDMEKYRVIIGNGGHLPVLLCREGNLTRLAQAANTPLGILPDMEFHQQIYHLKPSDKILLYTDGLVEARNAQGEELGFCRLEPLFTETPSSAKATLERILEGAKRFMNQTTQHDDLTLLCVEIVPQAQLDVDLVTLLQG